MITKEQYLNGVLKELERRKREEKSGLIRLDVKASQDIINHIRNYFSDKPEYLVQIEKACSGCANKWNIVILFKR